MFEAPAHPYSKILIDSVPSLTERQPLKITGGITHDPRNPPKGCIFQLRCPMAADVCRRDPPPMVSPSPGQEAACHFADKMLEAAHG